MNTVTRKQVENKSMLEVLEYCKAENLPARIVGRWIWILFADKPAQEVRQGLKDMGFRWSRRRGQWSHSCGHSSRPARSYKPWDKYHTTLLEDCAELGVA